MPLFRVEYVNQLDERRRILIGAIDRETADKVAAKMGLGVVVKPCDGKPDGAVLPAKG